MINIASTSLSRPTGLSAFGTLLLASALTVSFTGCKTKPAAAPDDTTLSSSLNAQISADQAINTLPIQGSVQGGVATLTGSVANDAQRTIAARAAASIQGIRSVVNDLQVGSAPASQAAGVPPPSSVVARAPQPAPLPLAPAPRAVRPQPLVPKLKPQPRQPAPIEQAYNPPPQPYTPSTAVLQTPPPPPPPPKPTFRDITIPSGTTLPVRITQTLDSATTQTGDTFTGVLASDILIDDLVALPSGTSINGHVDAVQEAAHFKGNSLLTVSLTNLRPRGNAIAISSEPYSVEGKGRGKNTAEKTGGGAAVGAILGGIFGGGKGAAIGAVAGGGVGAGSNAVTRGEQVQIPSETVVRFHLDSPITVHVRTDANSRNRDQNDTDPSLQHHPGL